MRDNDSMRALRSISLTIDDHADLNSSCATSEYKRVQNLRAPISSLPNEVLSAIFEAGCLMSSKRSGHPFELLVSQITQHLRNVAVGTPQLWTNITIFISTMSSDIAETYFHRSKALPVDLHIVINTTYTARIVFFSSIINRYVGRWRRIHVVSTRRAGLERYLSCLPPTAPLLQCMKISLSFDRDGEDESEIIRHIFPKGAPVLTSILLEGVTLQRCRPPLTTVTNLQLHGCFTFGTANLRPMFSGLSALTHLVVDGDFFGDWELIGAIELPSLRSCHIRPHDDAEQVPGLLKAISAPSLQSLLIDAFITDEVSDLAHTWDLTLVSPKYPSLNSLTVLSMPSTPSSETKRGWRNVMRVFPTITHFTLSLDVVDRFLEALHPFESSVTPQWPDLHTLALIDRPRQRKPTMLRDTVSTRIASGHPIRKLRLSKPTLVSIAQDLEWLRERVEVEEETMYHDFKDDDFVVNWPEDD